jgi:predicted aminopeptidase
MAKRTLLLSILSAAAVLAASAFLPGCMVGYLVRSAYYQGELLASRTPVAELRAGDALTPAQHSSLDTIADAKLFGAEIGLAATENYDTLAHGWNRRNWIVSACPPFSLDARTWWFPIIGDVPYIGHFREKDARKQATRLEQKGLETYVRTAGAYSTLGWFRDPIMMHMLEWGSYDLASTVLHELAHATIWVPGSVSFNESFASFVGEEAAFRYLDARRGPEAPVTIRARQRFDDRRGWRALLHSVADELGTLYDTAEPNTIAAREAKAAIFDSLHTRVDAGDFHNPARLHQAIDDDTWNNARMALFLTYNDRRPSFEALLAHEGGDLLAFMHRVKALTEDSDKPFDAITAHVQDF